MRIARTVLVLLLAFSVAAPAFATAHAHAMLHDGMSASDAAECCPHENDCEPQPDHCGSTALCGLICSNASAMASVVFAVLKSAEEADRPAFVHKGFSPSTDNPPLPPPRV